tara:strand:+ start:114 stop:443 length:330 start_codon:yes stop_codon:yes gene_type:complete
MSTSCKTCGDQVTSLVTLHESQTQKNILKQNKVGQSLYIQTVASLNNTINNENEGKKYDSYQRYLMKKKGKVLSKQGAQVATKAKYGNKTKSIGLSSKANSCDFCPSSS